MATSFRESMRVMMIQSWQFVRRYGLTMAQAMRKAWAILKLKKEMRKGIVKFAYEKVSGEIRTAWGTLAENLIGETKGTGRKPNDTLVVYWDSEKAAYRSFKAVNLITA